MRYILDNVLMQTETIKWCKVSHQKLILLKLDFRKAYDTLNLEFLFQLMLKLGILLLFVNTIKILFVGAKVSIGVNGTAPGTFSIKQGAWQGCSVELKSRLANTKATT